MSAKVLLIVVDNPAHRVMFTRYLQKTPHHLVYATDGEDAFDRFLEVKPDLVIAHMNVARLDGTILCQLLRQQPGGELVPVVLIGDEQPEDERLKKRITAVGADQFLPLPFSRQLLLDCITPLLTAGRPAPVAVLDPPTAPIDPIVARELTPVPAEPSELLEQPLTPSLMDSGEAPLGGDSEVKRETGDMDTVVTFLNPFLEGGLTPGSVPVPVVGSHGGGGVATEDPTTLLGERGPPLPEPPPPEPAEATGEVPQPLQPSSDLEPSPPQPPRDDPTEALERPFESAPGLTEEPQLPGDGPPRELPDKDLSTKSRMLLEPALEKSAVRSPPVSREPAQDVSTKSRLIQEMPRDERTPTGDRPAGRVGLPAPTSAAHGAAPRRGLDESQLGKRLAKRVRTVHTLLDEVDYYQLLGLEAGATLDQVRAAYFDLSLEFHPDRFFLLRSGELKEKIYVIYQKIGEAYRTLADEASRKGYDHARASRTSAVEPIELHAPPVPEPQPSSSLEARTSDNQARPLLELAEASFAQGDYNRARLFLYLARHYDRGNAALSKALEEVRRHLGPTL